MSCQVYLICEVISNIIGREFPDNLIEAVKSVLVDDHQCYVC